MDRAQLSVSWWTFAFFSLFLAFLNDATMNICVQVFCAHMISFLKKIYIYIERESSKIAGSYGNSMLNILKKWENEILKGVAMSTGNFAFEKSAVWNKNNNVILKASYYYFSIISLRISIRDLREHSHR